MTSLRLKSRLTQLFYEKDTAAPVLWLRVAAHFLSERRDVIVITVTVVAAGGSVGFMDDHPRSLLSPGEQECPPASAAAYAEQAAMDILLILVTWRRFSVGRLF